MKKIWILALCVGLQPLFAQKKDTINTTATLASATVYYGRGADLQHTAKANLVKGLQELVINQVAFYPDVNTIQISCPEHVTILSYKHRIHTVYPPVKPIPQPTRLLDSLKWLQRQYQALNNDITIKQEALQKMAYLIENNFTSPDKKTILSDELIKLTNYYTDKLMLIKQNVFELQVKRNDIQERIDEINRRIQEWNNQDQNTEAPKSFGQLIVQVMADIAGPVNVDFNYFTAQAGWTPSYDIRVKSLDNEFKIGYKAFVSQTTGLDWKQVKLSLSTGNPNAGTVIPVLTPLYLNLYAPILYSDVTVTSLSAPRVQTESIKYSNDDESDYMRVTKKTGYAGAAVKDVSQNLQLKESQLNVNFEINLPYDIPSDGQTYSVNIKEEKAKASYKHIAVPKLDQDAFLMAQLVDWDSLNLMPGNANIIMDNIFLGKTYLNPNTTDDTLSISLGRDKRIAIERKRVKDYTTKKRGDSKIEQHTYEITVRNNKKQAIEIDIKDQIPVSQVKEVEVTLTDDGKSSLDADTGLMNWELKLKPGETKKLRFSYQIKYPKDKVLQEYR
jgi:uncharacterized protein (TIGR02231 family)